MFLFLIPIYYLLIYFKRKHLYLRYGSEYGHLMSFCHQPEVLTTGVNQLAFGGSLLTKIKSRHFCCCSTSFYSLKTAPKRQTTWRSKLANVIFTHIVAFTVFWCFVYRLFAKCYLNVSCVIYIALPVRFTYSTVHFEISRVQ